MPSPRPLTVRSLRHAARALATRDPDLARVVQAYGPPPLWPRRAGFATLVHIILEQQVSLASAAAAFTRLSAAGPVAPETFLSHDDAALRGFGFSRQKAGYVRGLAAALLDGSLDLAAVECLDDDAARAALVRVRGIGPWTADIYLLMALRRRDVWPVGDLALASAVRRVKRLRALPTPDRLAAIAEPWRPYRAAAARILWHFYLSSPSTRSQFSGM
jgi:DNA-3-methyladenine glycosylase II